MNRNECRGKRKCEKVYRIVFPKNFLFSQHVYVKSDDAVIINKILKKTLYYLMVITKKHCPQITKLLNGNKDAVTYIEVSKLLLFVTVIY